MRATPPPLCLLAASLVALACAHRPAVSASSPPARDAVAQLAWLAGVWCGPQDDALACEGWGLEGDALVGEGSVTRGDAALFHERLRITPTPEGITYLATPQGRGTTPFRLTRLAGREAVFENPAHDFPSRLTYRLEGDTLTVVVEGSGRREVLTLTRAGRPTPRPLDAALRCATHADERHAGPPTLRFALDTSGDQGRSVQGGLAVVLLDASRVCSAVVASCDAATVGEDVTCDRDAVCARLDGGDLVVERAGRVVFRDRAPSVPTVFEDAARCASR